VKIDATNPKSPQWQRYLFPCDASDYHHLHLEWWDLGTDVDIDVNGYLLVTPTFWRPTLWGRIKGAVLVLLGREFNHADGVILDRDTAVAIRDTIDGFLAE